MPFTDAETDHLNRHGLLCAGRAACACCKKCDSCDYVYPGRPLLDFHSTPQAIEEFRLSQKCTVYLREQDALKRSIVEEHRLPASLEKVEGLS